MKRKKQMLAVGFIAILCLLLPNHVRAALQSNGATPATKNANEWITQIRQMQEAGGALGLTDTIKENELTSENTNLDIHMEKNTEYGAMAILSASSYGNPNPIANAETTTGNKTGVVMHINGERVAAGPGNTIANYMFNAAKRYWDKHGTDWYRSGWNNVDAYMIKTPKIGDATEDEMDNWHGANGNKWFCFFDNFTYAPDRICRAGLRRGAEGSIFNYNGDGGKVVNGGAHDTMGYSHVGTGAPTRAVVVVGTGI